MYSHSNFKYTYAFCILYVEFHDALIQTKFYLRFQHQIKD